MVLAGLVPGLFQRRSDVVVRCSTSRCTSVADHELTIRGLYRPAGVLGGIQRGTIGRYLIDREGASKPKGGAAGDEDRADTDVLARVARTRATRGWRRGRRNIRRRSRQARNATDYEAPTAYSEKPRRPPTGDVKTRHSEEHRPERLLAAAAQHGNDRSDPGPPDAEPTEEISGRT